MGPELFVYYRVSAERVDEALGTVTAFQARLRCQHPALRARLLRRPAPAGGFQTWMETYAVESTRQPGGLTDELQREIESLDDLLRPCIDGVRHFEVFEALPPR